MSCVSVVRSSMIKSVAAFGEYLSNSRQAVSRDLLAATETSRSAGEGGGGQGGRGDGRAYSSYLLLLLLLLLFHYFCEAKSLNGDHKLQL